MSQAHRQALRTRILADYGASPPEIEELLAYNQPIGDRPPVNIPSSFPLPPEPHITTWEQYAEIAQAIGTFETLQHRLVQLQFPIHEGISQTAAYQSATRKGQAVETPSAASGLVLQQPEQLELSIYQSLAGAIPVLIARHRADFIALVQALAMRNEPKPIPASMGSCIVSGFNNWDRVRQYRNQWAAANPQANSDSDWAAEFQRMIPQKERYQDRFILLSDGPYSAVSAADLELTETEWQRLSLTIRLEHECTHYFTRRILGSMRNNLLDELVADYRGIVAAIGCYRADWFLHFMGLESFPTYREGGRLQNYRGEPPLSPGAMKILAALVQAAATNLERFDTQYREQLQSPQQQALMILRLTHLTLEELASDGETLGDRLHWF
jgi:hypothetical protein